MESDALVRYGQRMRILRQRAGFSIREAANRAKVDKNTLMKLERGEAVRGSIRKKICRAYGIMELDPFGPEETVYGDHFALHRRDSERWFRTRLKEVEEPSSISFSDGIQDAVERKRQGTYGFANQFIKRLSCDRPTGRLRAALLEVFSDSGWASQASGEGFMYVIHGTLEFEIGKERCQIEQGSAITFDRTIRHRHFPSEDSPDLPVVILYVQTD